MDHREEMRAGARWLAAALRERCQMEATFGLDAFGVPRLKAKGLKPKARDLEPHSSARATIEPASTDLQPADSGLQPVAFSLQPSPSIDRLPAGTLADERSRREALLAPLREEVRACTSCPLHLGRTQTVFGVGDPCARLLFVGEGPGEEEDRQGEPFVGKAGQLLTRMIAAMGLKRSDVYIANIVKCRPPGNRNPEPREAISCFGYLRRQVEIIRPEVICALGNVAAKTLLGTTAGISRIRGRFAEFQGVPVLPTFHPAYLLRSPEDKRLAWEDLRKVMERLGLPLPERAQGPSRDPSEVD